MAGKLDTKMRALAKKLIPEYGKSITYIAVTPGGYVNGTGFAAESTADSAVTAVIENFANNLIDGTHVKRGDLQVIIDAPTLDDASITPDIDDRMTIGSETFKIINVEPVYSGALIAYFTFQIRKGQ